MSQKSKLPQFKKLIAEMDEVALREELLKLYTKLPIVKDFSFPSESPTCLRETLRERVEAKLE